MTSASPISTDGPAAAPASVLRLPTLRDRQLHTRDCMQARRRTRLTGASFHEYVDRLVDLIATVEQQDSTLLLGRPKAAGQTATQVTLRVVRRITSVSALEVEVIADLTFEVLGDHCFHTMAVRQHARCSRRWPAVCMIIALLLLVVQVATKEESTAVCVLTSGFALSLFAFMGFGLPNHTPFEGSQAPTPVVVEFIQASLDDALEGIGPATRWDTTPQTAVG